MNRARLAIAAAVLAVTVLSADGQNSSLQQSLSSKFAVTEISKDRSTVVNTGALLTLQRDNLLMYSSACPSSPLNTYNKKNGKLSQPFGKGFLRDLGGSMRMAGGATTADCPQRRFVRGAKLWVTRLDIQKDAMVFHLYSTPDNDIPYYGDLKFPFEKGSVPTGDEALTTIAEVLTVQAPESTANKAQPGQTSGESQVAAAQLGQIAGQYVMVQAPDSLLQLNSDGTFSQAQAGGSFSGTFTIEGNKLMARIGNRALPASILQGDTILDPDGSTWVKRKTAPPVPLPTVAPLRLPSTYISAQTPADQLQLNADNTFSLQEAGQTYSGTFAADGSTLKLNISGQETTATIQGNNLTDSSGQTWALREQPAQAASGAGVLQNQDIIKMVKAGLDDAIILAKIAGSRCQFDTSTDALIQLKQSGVSAAVMKAVVGAGK